MQCIKHITIEVNACMIIARADIKRGCNFYCIASVTGLHNTLKFYALSHADTPSEDFNIHYMKTRTRSRISFRINKCDYT